MKKLAIAFIIFASSITAQVQLSKNVQIGANNPDLGASLEQQVVPPVGGQSVFVPGTPTGATLALGNGGPFEIDDDAAFSGFTLPSYIIPANVTAIYAVAISSQTNYHNYNSLLAGPGNGMSATLSCAGVNLASLGGDGWGLQQTSGLTTLTGATFNTATCAAHIGANYSGGGNMVILKIGFQVYFTGSAPPADTNVKIATPLNYDSINQILSLPLPDDVAVDTGAVNAYAVSLPWMNFQPGATVKMLVAHNSTSATPTLTLNGNNPYTIVGPTGLALASGDMVTTVPAILVWNKTNWMLQNPQVSGSGGGTTTNALTANSSGGAAPGTTFNGSAARTFDYHSFGAAGISGTPTTGNCVDWASANTLGDTGSPCGSSGSVTQIVAGTNVTISPPGGTGVVTVNATAGGGSGVQYNPTTTAYIVGSVSSLYDDGNAQASRALPTGETMTCVVTTGTTCTMTFPSAHNVPVGGAVDVSSMTGWPSAGVQGAQFGSFQVATVPTATTLTFTTPRSITYTCSSSCGTAYDASYWAIWEMARTPYFYGHGTVYGFIAPTSSLDTNFSTTIGAVTGSPIYYIDDSGQNDFSAGASVAAVETSHLNVWTKAKAAGMTVVQATMTPAQYGINGVGTKPGEMNSWYYLQRCTPSVTAACVDRLIDAAAALLKTSTDVATMPTPSVNQIFANAMNEGFSTQSGLDIQPPTVHSFSASGLASDWLWHSTKNFQEDFYDRNMGLWMSWFYGQGGQYGITLNSLQNTDVFNQYFPAQFDGSTWCSGGHGKNGSTNNSFFQCFTKVTDGNTANYMSFRPAGSSTDSFRAYANGKFSLPASLGTTPNTSPICANGTNGELTITGCTGSSPLTTKGDLFGFSTTNARLPVGTDGQILSADSTQTLGLKWIAAPSGSFTALSGDATSTSTGGATTVVGLKGVPFCSGYVPTAGQIIVYTTGGTPNPCYAAQNAPSGSFTAGGDLAGTSSSQQVKGINGVPLCTGFTPTNGQNLQYTTASSPNPCYTAATGGSGWTLLQTLTASTSAGLAFTSVMGSTYNEYKVECLNLLPASDAAALAAQLSTNNGATWDTTPSHYMGGSRFVQMDGSASGANAGKQSFAGAYLSDVYGTGQPGISISATLFNPSTANWKQFTYEANGCAGSPCAGYYAQGGGAIWKNTAQANAINIILLSSSSPTVPINIVSGTCSLYGVKE